MAAMVLTVRSRVSPPTSWPAKLYDTNSTAVLSDEIESTMRLLGVTSLDQLNEDHVNAAILERELPPKPSLFRDRGRL